MLKAVLFDLDGTLLDTVPDIQKCVNDMLVSRGYPTIDYVQTCAYVGDGAIKLIERALPAGAGDVEECYRQFRTEFAASSNALTRLFPGELETLSALKARGLKLGIVTNKPQDATERIAAQFFPEGLFDFVGGDSGMFPCKPDPSLARYAALSMRVSPADCAFVGDGEPDVRVAANAGMCGVSVLWGYRTRAQLEGVGARLFADSFLGLQKILEKLS